MEDIENEGEKVDAETLRYIHENKTAALLTAALTMGLRFSNPDEEQIEAMQLVGKHLGLAFQIIDDILDATSDAETMGKTVGTDEAAEKSTYVALHGIEGARAEAAHHTEVALTATRRVGGQNTLLLEVIAELNERVN